MLKRLKSRIKNLGRALVYEGVERYFQLNPLQQVTKPTTTGLELHKLAPMDLGYYTWNRGPAISNEQLKNCKVVSTRWDALIHMPKNAICAEIGVAYGEYSEKILEIMEPHELHLIDLYSWGDFFGKDYFAKSGLNHEQFITKKFANNKNVKIVKGSSYEVLETYPDNYFDYVYLDAAHDYDNVVKDINVLHNKIKDGGILVFNDYTWFSPCENYEYGVFRAVNEFLAGTQHEVVMYCFEWGNGKMDDLIVKINKAQ